MTAAEARERFAAARVARLATVTPAGAPHLVPITFALIDESVYSVVDAKPKRTQELQRLKNVQTNPHVSLLADHYEEDWRHLWWVRADGKARTLTADEPEARRALAALAQRYPQQKPVGRVLAVDVNRWTGWSGSPDQPVGGDADSASG